MTISSTCPVCGAALPDGGTCADCAATIGADATAATGLTRVAHYEILRELGVGGMGAVYLAHDEKMNREVALKVMSRHQGDAERAGKRFEQEAWIAGRLDHPNLVKVYERGTWEELSYFSMEVVGGGALSDVIDAMRRTGRDESRDLDFGSSEYVHWAIRRTIDAAHGLDYAHRQGVVHRDIKPMNLLLSRELGSIKIADFGLAIDADATRMTTAGTVLGTVMFMAPEQIRGESETIDARTDIYALGVTLFEMLTLELPYSGKTQQMYMSQVLTSEARRASKLNTRISRDLEVVLRKAMEKERKDRYQTAAAFADDLENVLHLRPIQARPTAAIKRGAKWVRRKPVHAALALTLLVSVPMVALFVARTLTARAEARTARIETLLDEARWAEERQRPSVVLDRADELLQLDPGNAPALRHRAMARYQRWWALEPGPERDRLARQSLDDIESVAAQQPEVYWPRAMKAFFLRESGRDEEAEREQTAALQLRGDPPSELDLSEEARLAYAAKDYPRAVELFSELIRRQPGRVRSISSRALAYEEIGDSENAFVDYRVAVGLDPRYALSFVDLSRMSADRGNLGDARGYIDRAFEIDRESPFVHESHAHVLIAEGRQALGREEWDEAGECFERAEQAAREALDRDDGLIWARLNLATSLLERHRLLSEPDPPLMKRAVNEYRKVLDAWERPPERGEERDQYLAAMANTCDAEIQLGRLDEALGICSRTTVIFPEDATAFYNLAGVQALLGRHDEAIVSLKRDFELGDTDWRYLDSDKWFETLRGDERFTAVVAEMKRRAESDR